ncbi:MAG TPA: serine/threonine-protein kinase, partial [Streptosporangiaceae bacterium]|nr:serine/threonine-protein kinase [Streptosporangiaceae bacterium]
GMAVVYRAHDSRLDRHVALKILAPGLALDDAFRQRFIRESRAAAAVDHPNIIPVFDAGEADGVLFIAMRYVGSGDVRTLLQSEGPLPAARTAAIAIQAASALDAAHAHGLVHRDVKPGNMLIDSSGGSDHVYLSDFGLSKHSLASNTLTATGQFMGTLDYVSPEQIQGLPADGRADQYALACTVVEMLSGTPPYKRDESMALLWAQLEAPPPVLTQLRPDLPAEVNGVMQRALAKSPADRYPTCLAFAAALSAACDAVPAARPTTLLATMAPPPRADRPPAAPAGRGGLTSADPVSGKGTPGVPAAVPQRQADERALITHHSPRPGMPSPVAHRPAPPNRAGAPGPRPMRDDHLVPQRQPARRRRGRGRVVAAVFAIVVIAGACVAGFKLLHRPPNVVQPPVYVTVPPRVLAPTATVKAFFAAINAQNYAKAWELDSFDHSSENYQQFVNGYAGTERDVVTILSTDGNVVTARLAAYQTDGSVRTYQGTYTVTNGVITGAHVLVVGG